MWVVLVTFKDRTSNVSQEAYKTYDEALSWLRKKEIKQVSDYVFYDEDGKIKYELKNVYIK